jgi:hypothetical protein
MTTCRSQISSPLNRCTEPNNLWALHDRNTETHYYGPPLSDRLSGPKLLAALGPHTCRSSAVDRGHIRSAVPKFRSQLRGSNRRLSGRGDSRRRYGATAASAGAASARPPDRAIGHVRRSAARHPVSTLAVSRAARTAGRKRSKEFRSSRPCPRWHSQTECWSPNRV